MENRFTPGRTSEMTASGRLGCYLFDNSDGAYTEPLIAVSTLFHSFYSGSHNQQRPAAITWGRLAATSWLPSACVFSLWRSIAGTFHAWALWGTICDGNKASRCGVCRRGRRFGHGGPLQTEHVRAHVFASLTHCEQTYESAGTMCDLR